MLKLTRLRRESVVREFYRLDLRRETSSDPTRHDVRNPCEWKDNAKGPFCDDPCRWVGRILLALAGQSGSKGGSVADNKLVTRTGNRATQCNQHVSFRYGYSACIPPGWQELDSGADPPDLVNFPLERRETAVVIPSGGVSMKVIGPLRASIHDVDSWVDSDAVRETSMQTLQVCCRLGKSIKVVETTGQEKAVKPLMLSVNDYFMVGGRPFLAFVLFWEGDPGRDRYIKTLHEMILTLKVR